MSTVYISENGHMLHISLNLIMVDFVKLTNYPSIANKIFSIT